MSVPVLLGPNPPAVHAADVEQGNDGDAGGAVGGNAGGAAVYLAAVGLMSWWRVICLYWTIIFAMLAIASIIQIYTIHLLSEAVIRCTETTSLFPPVFANWTSPSFATVTPPQPRSVFPSISPPQPSPGVPFASPPKTSPKLGSDNDGDADADFGALGVPWCKFTYRMFIFFQL